MSLGFRVYLSLPISARGFGRWIRVLRRVGVRFWVLAGFWGLGFGASGQHMHLVPRMQNWIVYFKLTFRKKAARVTKTGATSLLVRSTLNPTPWVWAQPRATRFLSGMPPWLLRER